MRGSVAPNHTGVMDSLYVGGLAPWQKRRVITLVNENLETRFRVADLARTCGLSASHFARSFRTTFGVSAHRWLLHRRIEFSQELLVGTREPLVEIAHRAGFADQAAFTRTFHRIAGISPGRWRRHQRFSGAGDFEASMDKSDLIAQDTSNGRF